MKPTLVLALATISLSPYIAAAQDAQTAPNTGVVKENVIQRHEQRQGIREERRGFRQEKRSERRENVKQHMGERRAIRQERRANRPAAAQ